jgi:hypothetical protein
MGRKEQKRAERDRERQKGTEGEGDRGGQRETEESRKG